MLPNLKGLHEKIFSLVSAGSVADGVGHTNFEAQQAAGCSHQASFEKRSKTLVAPRIFIYKVENCIELATNRTASVNFAVC